jgi:hypothetical protein
MFLRWPVKNHEINLGYETNNRGLTAPTRKQGLGTLLTGKRIFGVQLFVESSVVKIPACV